MKRILFVSFIIILLLLASAVIMAPARFLARQIEAQQPDLEFFVVDGSIWNGSSERVDYKKIPFNNVLWQLKPMPLLEEKADLKFSFYDEQKSGSGSVLLDRNGTLDFSNAVVESGPELINSLITTRGVTVDGEFSLNVRDAQFQRRLVKRLDAELTWERAFLQTPFGQAQLGDFRVALKPDGNDGLTGEILDNAGPLDLQGTVNFASDGSYQVQGSVQQELPENLYRFFSVIAKPSDDGRFNFQFSGRLSVQ